MIYTRTRRRPIKRLLDLALVSAGLLACAALLPERAGLSIAQATAPSWSYTVFLNTPRNGHTATLLPNGKVLVAGGNGDGTFLSSAELYDPATGTWSYTGNLNTARDYHTATLLPNSKVLVAGGRNSDFGLNSAELYDPNTGVWSSTGSPNLSVFLRATLLLNGKVLVAGQGNPAQLYDPTTGTWSYTANLNNGRSYPTATLLLNGKVLITGGQGALNSAELYDIGSETVVLTTDQVTLKGWTYQGRTYAYVKLSFSDSGYFVSDRGVPIRSGNDFTLDARVERFTGPSIKSVVTTAQIYDLGPLAVGTYNFNFRTAGTVAKTFQFTVSSAIPPPNPIDAVREFVRQQYRDFLNREAD